MLTWIFSFSCLYSHLLLAVDSHGLAWIQAWTQAKAFWRRSWIKPFCFLFAVFQWVKGNNLHRYKYLSLSFPWVIDSRFLLSRQDQCHGRKIIRKSRMISSCCTIKLQILISLVKWKWKWVELRKANRFLQLGIKDLINVDPCQRNERLN